MKKTAKQKKTKEKKKIKKGRQKEMNIDNKVV